MKEWLKPTLESQGDLDLKPSSAPCWLCDLGQIASLLLISTASSLFVFYLKKIFFNLLIYLFLAALCLRCCARRLLFVAVCGLLTAVASLVAQHGL